MNKSQKTVILIGNVIVILMILFPPWSSTRSFFGYRFILTNLVNLKVDLPLLVIQEAIVLLTVIGLVLVLKKDD